MNAAEQRRAMGEAVNALARRVYDRDQLPDDERPDPRTFALEFVTASHGHGWRFTNATSNPWVNKPIVHPNPAAEHGPSPGLQEFKQARAQLGNNEQDHP